MKEGWTYKKLGEVCDLYQPQTISTKEFVPDGQYNVFGANGIIGKYNKYNHEHSEILMTCRGATCGTVNESTPKSWITGNSMVIHIKDENIVNRYFLKYALSFIDKSHIITGAAQPQITRQTLAPLIFAYPSISEQLSIVSRLDTAFANINALKANAEKQLVEARKLFHAELTECMRPKEGWEEKTLGEVCLKITDGTHNSPINTNSGAYMYVTAKNIKEWGLDLNNITYVSEEVHKEIFARCNPEKGDVLYIKDGATTGIAIVNSLEEEFSLLSSVALLKPDINKIISHYLCYALNSPAIYGQTRSQMDGAAITRVTLSKIKDFVIPLPPLSEQHQIVARLDALSAHVRQLEEVQRKTLAECDALKQAMLREVFE